MGGASYQKTVHQDLLLNPLPPRETWEFSSGTHQGEAQNIVLKGEMIKGEGERVRV